MPETPSSAATELATSKATETLSQFVARVLNQLSLSAWLPSAALVLGATWILTLGAVIDAKTGDAKAPKDGGQRSRHRLIRWRRSGSVARCSCSRPLWC